MKLNDSILDQQISRIAHLQSSGEPYFPEGLFPSFRGNERYKYHRPDTNLFFSLITLFTLQSIRDYVSVESQERITEIDRKLRPNYPAFQNKDGLKTYNFYQTKPSRHFPNGRLLYRFEHFRIPDDVDDTAMVYLLTSPTNEELRWFKQKLAHHANLARRQIRNTYAEYKNLRAYSTWFGKNMYIEFDACVLSNLLYAIYQYKLPLNVHDLDSLAFVRSVVETGQYRREPFRCAHSYPRTALIFYHVARLVATHNPEALKPIRQQLIADGFSLLGENLSKMDRLLVCTSLLRLGEHPEPIDPTHISEQEIQKFTFFVAGMLTAYENPVLYKLAPSLLVRMNWTCEAHSRALIAEYLVEIQKSKA